jgi:hypothetical protein
MTFAQRYERTPTITRKPGRGGSPPRMIDSEQVNQRVAETLSMIAPTGGLMLDVDVANIPEGGAIALNNYYCQADTVRVRGGSDQRNTGLGGELLSILTYETGATRKAFGVTSSSFFDVTNDGAVGAAVVTGLAAAVWSSTVFTTSGGTYLVACGDGNDRRLYDGTSWATTPAITGVAASDLAQVWSYVNRLFFVEGGTTNAWYLSADAVGGAAVKFPLGGEFKDGGSLLAGGTWSTDAGDNPQSMCVFMSTEGEAVVYEGPDPSSWSKRGTYRIPKPCGPNCFFRAGGDLAVMTEAGLFAMSQITSLDTAALSREAISKRIRPVWRSLAASTTKSRWQMIRRDAEGMAIVLPVTEGVGAQTQLVSNMETGAWSTWSGWLPTAMAQFGSELLFGTADGRIMHGEATGADEGAPYSCAFLGRSEMKAGRTLHARMGRAVLRAVETFSPRVESIFDYSTILPSAPISGVSNVGSLWDVSLWDAGVWGGGKSPQQAWQAITGQGSAIAPLVIFTLGQSTLPDIDLIRIDLLCEVGEVMTP